MSAAEKEATEATEPSEGLTLADVSKRTDMKGWGWDVVQNPEDDTWSATEPEGAKRSLGPAASIGALHTQVKIAMGQPEAAGKKVVVGKSNLKKGEFLFDEMKPVAQKEVPELRQPILDYQLAKERRMECTKIEVETKKRVDQLMHDHQAELAVDPQTGVKSYQIDDIVIELIPGEDKLKSRRLSDEEDTED